MKSVFLINGFLESGKTEFLTFTISQDYFQIRGTTLLLVCEQGEKEYDEELLKKTHTVVEYIEDKEGISASKLIGYEMKYKPERILIEYNGMWQKADLKLPWHWKIDQQVTLIDASTFPMYFGNMRSLINDMVNGSELIIFNRCDGITEQLPTYKRNIMALNRDAEIIFEDSNGEVVIEYSPKKSYQNVVFSSPNLKSNETYTLKVNGNSVGTITTSSIVNTNGNSNTGGRDGGQRGGRW